MIAVLLYAFIAVFFIQLVYYLGFFSKFSFDNATKKTDFTATFPVSIIICAKNEADNLIKNLPYIYNQNYSNFQVVLINDDSSDNTLDVMEEFELKHPNTKIVNVKSVEAFWGKKKYALTLGIKAAQHEHLVFTDADCKPISENWLPLICNQFSAQKQIILGYGGYQRKKKSLLNALIRFETVLTAIQYFSFAKLGKPYMGVGRNLAYTKSIFFEAKGFMTHMDILSGDDDLFVNQNAEEKNTAIIHHQESFTISTPKDTWKKWRLQKRRHVTTANHYKSTDQFKLGLFYSSQILFFLLAISLLINLYQWIVVVAIILIRELVFYLVVGKAAQKLQEKYLIWALPFYEIALIFFQFTIFIHNLFSKPTHWK
ncbi:glycosyltransferase [Zhouia sp. PK063]|uniref:glycosyltransferase n=1 Tax=Zhouia sp. PK063 TaxID=3373602 RepID=UPI0037A3907A